LTLNLKTLNPRFYTPTREVDYNNEAKNAEEFAAQFKGTNWIKVPTLTSGCLLTAQRKHLKVV